MPESGWYEAKRPLVRRCRVVAGALGAAAAGETDLLHSCSMNRLLAASAYQNGTG
jgi:hypothetical protein